MKRPPVSSVAQYGRPLALRRVEITSKQVRFSFGSTCTMRPPQRTRAPVLSSSAAPRGVIWLNSPCSGCVTVLQPDQYAREVGGSERSEVHSAVSGAWSDAEYCKIEAVDVTGKDQPMCE